MSASADNLFATLSMSAIFSPRAYVQSMLDFEAALAQAEARVGIIPGDAAQTIAASCRVELFDIAELYQQARSAGTPAIPLVHMLTAHVGADAGRFVHWGATSQDAIDSALMLQMREGLALLIAELDAICLSCVKLIEPHRQTLLVGRTLLQQALPITFGLKAARWLALVTRQLQMLRERQMGRLAVQLGGAVGTLASLGEKGSLVAELLAEELRLPPADLPWHTERDRVAEIATGLGILAGSMAKIAGDIVLMAQTELGEVQEASAPGKGGSSAMPQKHNPVDAIRAIASAQQAIGLVPVILSAMAQEHERAAGAWQAEWTTMPHLFCFTSGAVESLSQALAGLQVNPLRMQANLALTRGMLMAEALTMALAPYLGRPEAYQLVARLCQEAVDSGQDLQQVALAEDRICTVLTSEQINDALEPGHYLGSTTIFIDRALHAYQAIQT